MRQREITYKIDSWQYAPASAMLTGAEKNIMLTPLINKLLQYFVVAPQTTFSSEQLKQEVWQQEFLTDSAVKKAISELRQQIKKVSGPEKDYFKNTPGKGYYLDANPKPITRNAANISLLILGTVPLVLTLLLSWLFLLFPQTENVSSNNKDHEQANVLYLQGKSLYYKVGDGEQVEQRFLDSISLAPDGNPAWGALLDFWGLRLRSVKMEKRSAILQNKVASHIAKIIDTPSILTPDNRISIAKYYLVNCGDVEQARQLLIGSSLSFENVYDPHIMAFTLSLTGEKRHSKRIMEVAERRFPDRNVILWYKSFISLINGEYRQAAEEAQWAQNLAANWYPLVFITSHLLSGEEALAFEHLKGFQPSFLAREWICCDSFPELLNTLEAVPMNADFEPFEVEILFFLGKFFSVPGIQESARKWTNQHFPEKLMMLDILEQLDVGYQAP